MRLDREFTRLPLTFDASRLAAEIAQFSESDWRPHPQGYPGNSALALVSVDGDPDNDETRGPMRPTRHLERCPYLREVLAAFRSPIGRTRLMRIEGNGEARAHVDTNRYWLTRVRIHVPIVTDPEVTFTCGDASVHMAAGESWIFDTWRVHNVINPKPTMRIHLVADTKPSDEFWEIARGMVPMNAAPPLQFEEYDPSPDDQQELLALFKDVTLPNGVEAAEIVRQMIRWSGGLKPTERRRAEARRSIDRPIFIVSSPRSGSSLLFETLAQSPDLFTIGGESHALIEGIPALHPAHRGWDSNRLTEADATDALEPRFVAGLRDRDGSTRLPDRIRMLEKTPKNSLRIPFLRAIWPDALFIYLYRDPRATLSSMLDAWRSGRFVTYPSLPGWEGPPWSLVLVPGWRDSVGRPLAEVVAKQWAATTNILLDDLEALPPDSWCVASYDALTRDPQQEVERLCAFIGARWDRKLSAPLPLSRHTLTAPDPEKWRGNGDEIDTVFAPLVAATAERAHEVFANPPRRRVRVRHEHAPPERRHVFSSVHTSSFPELLSQLGISLLVSTYQSGRLVLLRAEDGKLNTHFRAFPSPMGIAVGPRSIALGTLQQVWDYRNQPELTHRLEPHAKHDACFVPRNAHTTGDIRIHEIAFDASDELWVVNTRFSALCTLDRDHSFVPRWRPPFISHLAAEDRCHLNGVAVIDGRPRYVTALGESNESQGWRAKKASGGVLIDIDSGESVLRGLSMPHSPRWYAGRMWILESGRGTLAWVDLESGHVQTVVELPGFTRGLAFAGPYAFVGLSQVRESNIFGGLPLTERLQERSCGVWAVDLRSGAIVAFVKFEDAVQEIFDVQVLHGIRYPELLEPDSELLGTTYVVPDDALAQSVEG